jgi:hypothetical protein
MRESCDPSSSRAMQVKLGFLSAGLLGIGLVCQPEQANVQFDRVRNFQGSARSLPLGEGRRTG